MNDHWAVVPVKGLTESKTRLSSYLGDKKKLLVEALLQDVLSSVLQSKAYDKVMVISPDENIADQFSNSRVAFVKQTGLGLNRAVEQANRLAIRENAVSLTIILADIPLAEPRDFAEIFGMGTINRKVVLVPSLKGGTNVMQQLPPGVIRPRYGRWSYSKHLRQAEISGIDVYSISNPRVSFDIDSVDDLTRLRRRDPEYKTKSAKVLRDIQPLLNQARIR